MTGEPRLRVTLPYRRRLAPAVLATLGLVTMLLVPAGSAWEPVGETQDDEPFVTETVWDLEIPGLEKPELRSATGFSTLHLSPSGETLIAGLSNGGSLFIDAQTGEVTATAQTKGHGPVRTIASDAAGQRAGFVYEDGYLAVVDKDQNEPLTSRFSEAGAPEQVRDRVAVVLSPDGQTLVMATDRLQVYRLRGEAPEASFDPPIADRYSSLGPHLFLHPVLPIVAAMNDGGTLGVFDLGLNPQIPAPVKLVDSVADVAVSSDGSVFAVLQGDGRVSKYQIHVGTGSPELELLEERNLTCREGACGSPVGVALDEDGSRLLAWSDQEVLFTQGPGPGDSPQGEQGNGTVDPVRLHPEGSRLFGHVVPDPGLDRVLVTQVAPDGTVRADHHGLPSGERFEDELGVDPDPQGLALHPVEGMAYVTRSARLYAVPVTPSPLADSLDDGPGDGAGEEGFGGFLAGNLVAMMAGLGALGFTAFLAVLVAARRGDDKRLISELELDKGPMSRPASARASLPGGGPMSKVRLVTPSAPPEPDAPDGLLVLEDVHVPGRPALSGLELSLNRPGVVRVKGQEGLLQRFQSALAGRAPTTGMVSAGGAVRASTPVLFASHLRIGLPAPQAQQMPVREWYVQAGVKRGVPKAVVDRRLQADLGWMGARLDAPYKGLSGFDRWRSRLAVAFSDRPKVLVVWTRELPGGEDEEDREKVRQVLFAVARRYGAVVVLLDPGNPLPEDVVRRWAHEEFRLTPSGFHDRTLLAQGRVVKAQASAENGAKGPDRAASLQKVVQNGRRRSRRR